MMAVVKIFQSEEKPTSQKLISELDRNGLWYIFREFLYMLINCFAQQFEIVRKIDQKQISDLFFDNTNTTMICVGYAVREAKILTIQ